MIDQFYQLEEYVDEHTCINIVTYILNNSSGLLKEQFNIIVDEFK